MSVTSIVIEKDLSRRERATPLDRNKPARRFLERHADGMRVYEYVGNDAQGRREYRLMGTERLR